MPIEPPDLDAECDRPLDQAERARLRGALRDSYGAGLDVDGREGQGAAMLVAVVGPARRAHEILVFARGDDAKAVAVDYLDGLLAEIVGEGRGPDAGYFLPLGWAPRDYDGHVVWVRGEVRDYLAEEEAARLLGEPAPPRAVRR